MRIDRVRGRRTADLPRVAISAFSGLTKDDNAGNVPNRRVSGVDRNRESDAVGVALSGRMADNDVLARSGEEFDDRMIRQNGAFHLERQLTLLARPFRGRNLVRRPRLREGTLEARE